jgi:Tfp pilus assembly protein PilO
MTFKERILLSVASWQWWQRYAVTILFLCTLVTCWWFLSYRSLWTSVHYLRMQTSELCKQLPVSEQEAEIMNSAQLPAECAIESIDVTFEKRLGAFFTLKCTIDAANKVFAAAAQEQLRLDTYQVSPTQTKDWYAYSEMNIVLTGEFFKVVNFLERLQKYDNIIVQQCEMTLHEASSKDPLTQCACTLSIMLPLT